MQDAQLRVDWFRVLDDLKRAGYGLRDIEFFVGIPRSSLFRYRAGSEPGYSMGDRLLRFWADATGCDASDPPMVCPFSMHA